MNEQDRAEMKRILDVYMSKHFSIVVIFNIWSAILMYYGFTLSSFQGWLSLVLLLALNVVAYEYEKQLRYNIKTELAIHHFITIED